MNEPLIIDDHCFACGCRNANGLKLQIQNTSPRTSCVFVLDETFQGYGGILHGGILSTVLDELMIYALYFQEIPTVTAKMEVVFKQKVYAGETLKGEAWKVRERQNMVEAEAVITNMKEEVVASAKGLFAKVERVVRT